MRAKHKYLPKMYSPRSESPYQHFFDILHLDSMRGWSMAGIRLCTVVMMVRACCSAESPC